MSYFAERATKKVTLPSNKDYWVEIVGNFKWGETKQLFDTADGETVEFKSTADKILVAAIVNWNLDLEDGTTPPIDQENIDKLEQADVLFILNELNLEADSASKKNSSRQ